MSIAGNVRGSAQHRAIAIVCTLFFLTFLGNSLWLSLFPNHLLRLGMDSLLIGVILMVYNASLSLCYSPSGRLSDKVGRKPLILAGSSLLAVGTLGLSLSNDVETTVLMVIVDGIGLALLVPAGNALIAEVVPGRRSGSVYAIYQIVTLSASVVGSFAAGTLAENVGFSRLFLLSATIAGGATVMGYMVLPETLSGEANSYTSAVKESVRSSVTGTATLFRSNKKLALLASALVIHSISYSMITPFVPLFGEKGIGLDISQVGVIMSVWNAGIAIAQLPSGSLTDRFGGPALLLAHFVLSTISWPLYALSWNLESGIATVFLFGIVGALDIPARRTIMIEYASAEAGKATIIGSLDAITGAVGIVGPLLGGVVWANMGYSAPFFLAGFVNAFACVPLLMITRRWRHGYPGIRTGHSDRRKSC